MSEYERRTNFKLPEATQGKSTAVFQPVQRAPQPAPAHFGRVGQAALATKVALTVPAAYQMTPQSVMTGVTAQRQAAQPVIEAAQLSRADEVATQQVTQRLAVQRRAMQDSQTVLKMNGLEPKPEHQLQRSIPAPEADVPHLTPVQRQALTETASNTIGSALTSHARYLPPATRVDVASQVVQRFKAQGLEAAPLQAVMLQRAPDDATRQAAEKAITAQRQVEQRQAKEHGDHALLTQHAAVQRQLQQTEQQHAAQQGDAVARIEARRGGGQPLPAAVRKQLELGLNHDLTAVRLHTDGEADLIAKQMHAVAFTSGKDVYFQSGEFDPVNKLELLAHEVAHTVQQAKGQVGTGIDPDAGLETEARQFGKQHAQTANQSEAKPQKNAVKPTSAANTMQRPVQRQAAPATASPAVDQAKLAQLRRVLAEYKALVQAGKITPVQRHQVEQSLAAANSAVRRAERVAGQGSSVLAAAGIVGGGGSAVLIGDDVTVIGVADDVALPFVWLAAGGLLLIGHLMSSSTETQRSAWNAAQGNVDAAVATVGNVVMMAKRSRTETQAPPISAATTTTQDNKAQQHRGRLQVQGSDMARFPNGELSWAWTQPTPSTAVEAVAALAAMKSQLGKRELALRVDAFTKAEARIIYFQSTGGVSAIYRKTFQDANLPKGLGSARVDIEVLEGKAFI